MGKLKHTDLRFTKKFFGDAQRNEYIDAEKTLLAELKAALKSVNQASLGGDPYVQSDREELLEKTIAGKRFDRGTDNWVDSDMFSEDKADWARHPKLWSHSSRTHATKIVRDKPADCDTAKTSTFDDIHDLLRSITPAWYQRDPTNKAIRREVNLARKRHVQLRKMQKRKFLFDAKREMAKEILDYLDTEIGSSNNNDESIHLASLKKRIKQIQGLKSRDEDPNSNDVNTSKQCLRQHREIGRVAKDLKQYMKRKGNRDNKATQLIDQFELVSKRWVDPHYKNPAEKTAMDKFRSGMKIFSWAYAAVASITAFVMFFTPAAPFAPFVGASGLIGLWPLADTAVNIVDNTIRYRRGPMRAQSIELGIAVPFIATILTAINLPGIGLAISHLGQHGSTVVQNIFHAVSHAFTSPQVTVVSEDISKFGLNGLAGTANTVLSVLNTLILKRQSRHANNEEQLKTHKTVSSDSARKILMATSNLKDKTKSLWAKPKSKGESYMWKDNHNCIKQRDSANQVIRSIGFFRLGFASVSLQAVKSAHKSYCNLPSNTSLKKRKVKLEKLKSEISEWRDKHGLTAKWKTDSEKSHVTTSFLTSTLRFLNDKVIDELATLDDIISSANPAVVNPQVVGPVILVAS